MNNILIPLGMAKRWYKSWIFRFSSSTVNGFHLNNKCITTSPRIYVVREQPLAVVCLGSRYLFLQETWCFGNLPLFNSEMWRAKMLALTLMATRSWSLLLLNRLGFWSENTKSNTADFSWVCAIKIWVFPKLGVPQNASFRLKTPLKLMIWGYRYFWKHPYLDSQ